MTNTDADLDVWERLRHMTLDQLVTAVKLRASGAGIRGYTTPEGWDFRIVVAVASPGNERAVELADQLHRDMTTLANFTVEVRKEEQP